ncbi:MAG: hypothetical protein ACOX7N_10915, partial [Lawsonibacter sp.]
MRDRKKKIASELDTILKRQDIDGLLGGKSSHTIFNSVLFVPEGETLSEKNMVIFNQVKHQFKNEKYLLEDPSQYDHNDLRDICSHYRIICFEAADPPVSEDEFADGHLVYRGIGDFNTSAIEGKKFSDHLSRKIEEYNRTSLAYYKMRFKDYAEKGVRVGVFATANRLFGL